MRRKRRQKTFQCGTHSQFERMVEWAVWLGLEWNYGHGQYGKLRVGQGRFPMTYGTHKQRKGA